MNTSLSKKLKSLIWGELSAGIVFLGLYVELIYIIDLKFDYTTLIVLLVLFAILVQGSLFWYYIYQKYIKGKDLRIYVYFFRFCKILDIGMLLTAFAVLAMNRTYILLNISIWVFAVLEYINYFYVRISYPVSKFFVRLLHLDFGASRMSKEFKNLE